MLGCAGAPVRTADPDDFNRDSRNKHQERQEISRYLNVKITNRTDIQRYLSCPYCMLYPSFPRHVLQNLMQNNNLTFRFLLPSLLPKKEMIQCWSPGMRYGTTTLYLSLPVPVKLVVQGEVKVPWTLLVKIFRKMHQIMINLRQFNLPAAKKTQRKNRWSVISL